VPVVEKITKSFVDTVPNTEKGQIGYCDKQLPGFYLVVGMRAKTYVVQKDIQGKAVRCTIGRHTHVTAEQARKIAKEHLFWMSQGINPNEKYNMSENKDITLIGALEGYLVIRRGLKERSQNDYRYYIDKYLPDWRNKQLCEITKSMIVKRHGQIGERHGSASANKAMRLLRALYNYAIPTYDLDVANPVHYLTQVKGWYKENRRRTYIKSYDLKAWWKAVHELENDTCRDFLVLLLFTGLRRKEGASLRWEDIDFRGRMFTVTDTKNGDPLTLPLSSFLMELLETRRKRYGNYEYVFPGSGKNGYLVEPKKGVYKVIEKSGVKFSCHDLRRTFITIAESLDLSHYALKRLINHRVTDITGSYIIVDVERLREPVQRVADFILEKVE